MKGKITPIPKKAIFNVEELSKNFQTAHMHKRVDLSHLKDFTKGDELSLLKYINMFLASAPHLMTSIEQALRSNDRAALCSALHTIKPQLKFTGINEEFDRTEIIETMMRNYTVISPALATEIGILLSNLRLSLEELEIWKKELFRKQF